MNREIKFRVWDSALGIMCYTENNAIYIGEDYWIESEGRAGMLMQYTGLKDKNGKNIYEGDVLIVEPKKNWVIIWDNYKPGFYLQEQIKPKKFDGRIGKPQVIAQKYLVEQMEIIGNIYENQELLNDAS